MPNIVATFNGGGSGRHLALNGHMDVFPVEDATPAGASRLGTGLWLTARSSAAARPT